MKNFLRLLRSSVLMVARETVSTPTGMERGKEGRESNCEDASDKDGDSSDGATPQMLHHYNYHRYYQCQQQCHHDNHHHNCHHSQQNPH